MKKNNFLLITGFLFILLLFSLSISTQTSSPLRQFTVTPDITYLNWTNNYISNITMIVNDSVSNIFLEIMNDTSATANYSQLVNEEWCYYLHVRNNSDMPERYNNVIGPISGGSTTNATLIVNPNRLSCSPGRYWINKFTIQNNTPSETANVTVFIDIPISSSNSITPSINNVNLPNTGVGYFGVGANLPINATFYHSYYLNTSSVTKATGVMINLSGWSSSQDVDLFLFDDSSNLKAKSINKSSTSESVLYNFLPTTEKIWEIRIYGNSTSAISYNGVIAFTTLNVTSANSSNILISSLDFGALNASSTAQKDYTLKNEGNLNLSNVIETKELYHIERFIGNVAKNFTFLVSYPPITRVKAILNWTGSSNYTLKVYNQDDYSLITSTSKYVYANRTGAMEEEYGETSTLSSGKWKVGVINNANANDLYNVTIYMYINPSNWIATNYTTMNFNMTNLDIYNITTQMNLTVQNTTMNGLYEGYVQYLDGNKAGVRIPILFSVTTPMLVINDTLNYTSITVNENYGNNMTKSVYINVSNMGAYDFVLELTNSSSVLYCVSGTGCNTNYNATLTFNTTNSISNYSSKIINITTTFNSSVSKGLYQGWILFNTNNSITALSSHPSETFNLTVNLNLTDSIDLNAFGINDTIVNVNTDENVTVKFKLYYINGTEFLDLNARNSLNTSNFTVWLTSMNISSYRIPSSGGISIYNGSTPYIYNPPSTGPYYSVKFTVPANKPGDYYKVNVIANYTSDVGSPIYGGYSSNQTLIVNRTGLQMSTNYSGDFGTGLSYTPTITLVNNTNSKATIYVNVSNYGPVNATPATINFTESCSLTVVTNFSTCGATPSGTQFSIASLGYPSSCVVWWTITASKTNETCYANITDSSSSNQWFNKNGINITVSVTTSIVSTTTSTATTVLSNEGTSGTTGTTNRTATALLYLDITSYPSTVSIEQGGNKTETVKVKNINKTITQNVKLEIFGIEDSSWYSIVPSTYVPITNQSEYTFFVAFNIPKSTAVNDYPALFKASSSYNNTKKNFVLEVTPGEETKTQITLNISNYKTQILSLEKELNQSKSKGVNVSEAESLFSQLKQKITSVDAYIALGDFDSAYDLLDDIESLINQTKSAMKVGSKLDIGKMFNLNWQSLLKWGVVGGAVAGIAFFGYLFWPTPIEYKPETSLKTSKTGFGIRYKIVEILRKIKEKLTFKKRNEQALSYKK